MSLARRHPFAIFRSVVFALIMREISTKYSQYRLGYAWIILQPVSMIVIFTFVFGAMGRVTMPGVPFEMFILTGWLPFQFFGELLSGMQNAPQGIKDYLPTNRSHHSRCLPLA